MSRSRLAALLLVATTAVAVPAQAGPPVDGPDGVGCSLVSTSTSAAPNQQVGVLTGGPIDAAGTLRCTIQVGSEFHDSADTEARFASNTNAVTLNPTGVTFNAPFGVPVYLCTQWTSLAGFNLYWHALGPNEGHWTTDAHKACLLMVWQETDSEDMLGVVRAALCPILPFVVTGPVLGGLVVVGPDGDLTVAGSKLLDCPPFDAPQGGARARVLAGVTGTVG